MALPTWFMQIIVRKGEKIDAWCASVAITPLKWLFNEIAWNKSIDEKKGKKEKKKKKKRKKKKEKSSIIDTITCL